MLKELQAIQRESELDREAKPWRATPWDQDSLDFVLTALQSQEGMEAAQERAHEPRLTCV